MKDWERISHDIDSNQFSLLSALADIWEEEGRGDWAKGLRWLAQHNRWPIKQVSPQGTWYTWWQDKREDHESYYPAGGGSWTRRFTNAQPGAPVYPCTLPGIILRKIKETSRSVGDKEGAKLHFSTPSEAIHAVVLAISLLRSDEAVVLYAWQESPDTQNEDISLDP